ncbi:glycosyltransferase family 39 protein [Candidatus Woesebacteria bacterium]|nr:glycosyltransferase family 39 protein [Candidatus Woesebacteria bacterium]
MKFIKKNILLISIVIFAFILRFFNLSSFPPSLNWDEISHGYNAYSVLKTGTDEWGALPIGNFRAYGDYPLTANLYLTVPFVALFGLTEFAIRFPHVLLGVGTVIATYFLAKGVTKRKDIALLSSFLIAVDPWTLFTSRFVLQSNISIFLLVSAFACFFNRDKYPKLLTFATVLFGMSLFAYHTTRIVTPLVMLLLVLVYRRSVVTKSTVILTFLFAAALGVILLQSSSRARANEVFLLNPGVVAQIESQRNESTWSPLVSKIIYNRPIYLLTHTAKNYIEYFSPTYLFIEGGTQYQFSVPHHGLMYVVWLPFFYIGLFTIVKRASKKDTVSLVLLGWLLIAPIPASITVERFAVLRATSLLPLPELFSAIGIFAFCELVLKSKRHAIRLVSVVTVITLLLLARYLTIYTTTYTKDYSWAWQYGYKEAVIFSQENYSRFDKIIVTKKYGEPHEFFLFYGKIDPMTYKTSKTLNRFTQSNWWWVDSFEKYVFMNDWQIPKQGDTFVTESKQLTDCTSQRCLLITAPGNAPSKWSKIKTIYFLDMKPAFELYENN